MPRGETARRVRATSRGYTQHCARAPAAPPAAKRSSGVGAEGAAESASRSTSKPTNLRAVSGAIFRTFTCF